MPIPAGRPLLFRGVVSHSRRAPIRHAFRYRVPLWLVDVDTLPELRGPASLLLRFDARDHLGAGVGVRTSDVEAVGGRETIRGNLDSFLRRHGLEPAARAQMLATPRSLGHAFNPLTVFWCRASDGSLTAVVAEVHNTYGERHCYLLQPDADGRAEADKQLYVSPFFPVDGRYEMRLQDPEAVPGLDVAITLHRDEQPVFHASLTSGPGKVVRSPALTALRHPLTAWWVTARIRVQGVRLWLRRLPVVPRPVVPRPVLSSRVHSKEALR